MKRIRELVSNVRKIRNLTYLSFAYKSVIHRSVLSVTLSYVYDLIRSSVLSVSPASNRRSAAFSFTVNVCSASWSTAIQLRFEFRVLRTWNMRILIQNNYIDSSDVDPDPVGSAFIWVRGSGSRGIKLRKKQSLTKKMSFFVRNSIFQVWN